MTVTAFWNTSDQVLSVGLLQDGKIIGQTDLNLPRQHNEQLLLQLNQLLSNSNLKAADINELVVMTGPGSFTGLRIALATATGLATALNIPIYGYNKFELFSFGAKGLHPESIDICICLDAKRKQFYRARYSYNPDPRETSAPELLSLDDLTNDSSIFLVSDIPDLALPHLSVSALPSLVELALKYHQKFKSQSCSIPNPLYIRPPDAKLPKQILK